MSTRCVVGALVGALLTGCACGSRAPDTAKVSTQVPDQTSASEVSEAKLAASSVPVTRAAVRVVHHVHVPASADQLPRDVRLEGSQRSGTANTALNLDLSSVFPGKTTDETGAYSASSSALRPGILPVEGRDQGVQISVLDAKFAAGFSMPGSALVFSIASTTSGAVLVSCHGPGADQARLDGQVLPPGQGVMAYDGSRLEAPPGCGVHIRPTLNEAGNAPVASPESNG